MTAAAEKVSEVPGVPLGSQIRHGHLARVLDRGVWRRRPSPIFPGQVAQRSGFSVDTLRYDERIGLLDRAWRTASGRRRLGEQDLEWPEVLRCLRDTGMPIAQLRRYAELARGGQPTVAGCLRLLTGFCCPARSARGKGR